MKLADRKIKFLLIAVFWGIFFWIFESGVMAFFLHSRTFREQLLTPTSHEIWQRLLVFAFTLGFASYAYTTMLRRKQAAIALSESEEKYRHLVELSPDAILVQCKESIVFINSAGLKLFGADSSDQIIGKPIWNFLRSEDQEIIQERLQRVNATQNGIPLIEQNFIRLDGSPVVVEISVAPFIYDGKPAIQAIFRDITKRKQAEEELGKLRKAVERSGEIIFLTDREGLITYINPEFSKVYGYSAEEVINKVTPRILKSGMLSPQDYEAFWQTILDNQVVKGIWVNKCKDDKMIDVEGSANPVFDESGELVGFLAIQRDITERRRAEENIEQRNKELATLYTVAEILGRTRDLDEILDDTLGAILELDWLGGDTGGTLCLLDPAKQNFRLVAHRGVPLGPPCLTDTPDVEGCLCGLVLREGDVVITDGAENDIHQEWSQLESHSDICLPIKAYGDVLGILSIRLPLSQEVSDSDIELLKSVTDQIGLAIKNSQLCQLNQQITLIERGRIARELHDNMGQLLGYVNTKAMAIRLFIEKDQMTNARENLLQLEEAAQGLSVDVRKAILDLKTSGSGNLSGSLLDSLNDYVSQFNRLSNLYVNLEVCPEVDEIELNTETKLQILRIVQEALSNIRKHAKATKVSVILDCDEDILDLKIVDNGCGFDLEAIEAENLPRFGLGSMRERAASIGGTFRLETSPGIGTTVFISRRLGEKERV